MENKLPMIKKEGIFSKILNKLKNIFGKKEVDTNKNVNGIQLANSNKLTIVDENRGIVLKPHEFLKNSLEIALSKTNMQVTNGQIDLTNMPLGIQNEFLEKLISVAADNMCIIFDDEFLNENEARFSQKKKIFHKINFTLNMPRSMEQRGTPLSDERKNNMYFEMLNSIFDYVKETVEFLDGQSSEQNETRKQFIESIEQNPGFVDPNNIMTGKGNKEQNQR